MAEGMTLEAGIIAGDKNNAPEAMVLSKERWEEVRRLQREEGLNVSEIARRLDVDRKTVKKALLFDWKPYERPNRCDTLLAAHGEAIQSADQGQG